MPTATADSPYLKADGPFHPSGIVMEIVGMEMVCQGCSCNEHCNNCGKVMAEDIVVHLRKVQILVERQEETVIAAVWINNGINRCRIGFLPHHMVKHAVGHDGAVAQVTHVL